MSKKLLFNVFVLSFLALSSAKAQNIQFEDAIFKARLLSAAPDNGIAKDVNGSQVAIDTNGDGEISQAEALNIGELYVSAGTDITSMKGIEYFMNLTVLSWEGLVELESLDLSKNIKLQDLSLVGTGIKTLDVSKNINLENLDLRLTSGIKTLDLSKNINLQNLYFVYSSIETLDVSHNINLTTLVVWYCSKLTSLYMKNGVKKNFDYNDNGYYYFDYTNLNYICCDENEIDDVKTEMQRLAAGDMINGWQLSNLTITSDCETYGLGTEDLLPQAKVMLYPNPVKDVLYFSASGKVAKAEIYDLNGRLIKTAAVSNNSVNVSSLSKGVYFIILHTDKGTVKEKFIKN